MLSDLQLREAFHFLFLHRLAKTARDQYVVKGGINLRFFHGSPRYSDDLDIDVRGPVSVPTLQKNTYKILDDPQFLRVLRSLGIDSIETGNRSSAKQTETTQRFKVSLVKTDGTRLPTKVEFSRRGLGGPAGVLGAVDREVARRYRKTAFVCEHYDAEEAAKQKIGALADRTDPQARDLFDLYLLDSRGALVAAAAASVDVETRGRAVQRVLDFTEPEFEGQVLEFLEAEDRDEFAHAFSTIQQRVYEVLGES